MSNNTKNVRQYFEAHPDVNELFFTNDHLEERGSEQLAFFREDLANSHARNLKDKTVTRVTREQAFEEAEITGQEPQAVYDANCAQADVVQEEAAPKRGRKAKQVTS